MVDTLRVFDWFVLVYFVLLNSTYLVLIAIAGRVARRTITRPIAPVKDDVFANPLTPPISIILPAFNEERCIVDSVRSASGLRYPELEVVVVDDGSTDATFDVLQREFGLIEVAPDLADDVAAVGAVRSVHVASGDLRLTVVRKVNAGRRADALNVGINAARHELICCVDADSILESDALLEVVRPFVDDPTRVLATGGGIRAVNGSTVYRGRLGEARQSTNWWVRIQVLEYLRSFLLGRTGWSQARALLIISGAFGLYRRDALVAVGGFDPHSLGEDCDVLVAIHRWAVDTDRDYRIVFVPEANCWTEVPSSRRVLARQRRRWSHGLFQVLWKQRGMFFRRRYGKVGNVALPYWLAFELLTPIVEVVGVAAVVAGLAFGVVNVEFAILFACLAFLYGYVVSLAALVVEEVSYRRYRRWRDLGASIVAAAIENVGYRQLHAWWRLQGLWSAVLGRVPTWGEMERSGFDGETVTEIPARRPAATDRLADQLAS